MQWAEKEIKTVENQRLYLNSDFDFLGLEEAQNFIRFLLPLAQTSDDFLSFL